MGPRAHEVREIAHTHGQVHLRFLERVKGRIVDALVGKQDRVLVLEKLDDLVANACSLRCGHGREAIETDLAKDRDVVSGPIVVGSLVLIAREAIEKDALAFQVGKIEDVIADSGSCTSGWLIY